MPSHSHRIGLEHDLNRARALLADTGYPDGRGLPELGARRAPYATGLDELERQWNALGIRLRVVRVALKELPSVIAGGAHFWAQGFTADFPDPDGFLRGLAESILELESTQIASLFEHARLVRDRDERLQLYQAIDRWLVRDEVRTVPLLYLTTITTRRPWVRTWTNALMNAPLDEVFVER